MRPDGVGAKRPRTFVGPGPMVGIAVSERYFEVTFSGQRVAQGERGPAVLSLGLQHMSSWFENRILISSFCSILKFSQMTRKLSDEQLRIDVYRKPKLRRKIRKRASKA
jgi:hypothetical protein